MAGNDRLGRDLTRGGIVSVLYRLAIPVMLSNLLQSVYNMVDMMVIGRYEGSVGLSSVSVGGDVLHLFLFIGTGFATASQIMVSQYIGAGKHRELNRVIGTLFSFIILLGLVMSALGCFGANAFLNAMNVPEAARDGAFDYLVCCSVGIVFTFGYNVVSAVLRGMGDSRHPMMFIAFATVLNMVLDVVFVGALHMGAFGAALATITAQALSLTLSVIYLYRHRQSFGFDFKPASFRIDVKPLRILLRLGIPIAIQHSAASISALFVNSHINTYGVAASAITGVGSKLTSIALIVANALNTSGSSIIGQSFGAGKMERVSRTVYTIFISDLIFVSLLSAGILAFPEKVFGLFNSSEDVLSLSRVYAPVMAITFMGYAVRSPSLALINGLGYSQMNFFMGITEGIILRIGLTWLLGIALGFGIQGFWYGSAIASYGYGLVVFPFFFSGKWRKLKNVSE